MGMPLVRVVLRRVGSELKGVRVEVRGSRQAPGAGAGLELKGGAFGGERLAAGLNLLLACVHGQAW
jgi:hypothetical protein